MIDSTRLVTLRCVGAFRYAWLFSTSQKRASGANIVRRIADVIHYSVEAWRSSKSRDFHRRARRRVRAYSPAPPPFPRCFLSEGWQSSPVVFHDPKISSRSHDEIGKLTRLFGRGASFNTIGALAPPTHTRFPLYDALRGCRDSDEYSLEGFITSIYVRVSNSYPERSIDTIEPTNVYPTPFPRIPVDELLKRHTFQFCRVFLITFKFLWKKIFSCIATCKIFYILSLQYETISYYSPSYNKNCTLTNSCF